MQIINTVKTTTLGLYCVDGDKPTAKPSLIGEGVFGVMEHHMHSCVLSRKVSSLESVLKRGTTVYTTSHISEEKFEEKLQEGRFLVQRCNLKFNLKKKIKFENLY